MPSETPGKPIGALPQETKPRQCAWKEQGAAVQDQDSAGLKQEEAGAEKSLSRKVLWLQIHGSCTVSVGFHPALQDLKP